MKIVACLFMLLLSIKIEASALTKYVLGPGDRINISVYQEPELNTLTKVNQSGYINLPLVGQIKLVGLSIEDATLRIEESYKDGYLNYPDVTLLVEEYRPFFIHGEVKSPGSYKYQAEISLEQAIALAGGLKDRASRTDWLIWRGFPQKSFVAKKSEIVLPGDVIKIEKSFF